MKKWEEAAGEERRQRRSRTVELALGSFFHALFQPKLLLLMSTLQGHFVQAIPHFACEVVGVVEMSQWSQGLTDPRLRCVVMLFRDVVYFGAKRAQSRISPVFLPAGPGA